MKKEERLHHLFGDIDDDLVADAARKPVRKAVWVPLVAAAACVALTVGLWQGNVFDPTAIPVEPDKGTSTTVSTVEPTTTAKPTEPSKTETTTKTDPTKTTGTTVNEKTIVFADEPGGFIPNSRLDGGYMHPTVEDKMEQYKGQDVLYAVIVEVYSFHSELLENYPEQAPYIWEDEEVWLAHVEKYLQPYIDQRVEKLKEITGKELIPISTDDKYWGFYAEEKNSFFMELTAEEIHKLDQCDCYFIRLRHPDGDEAAGLLIPG